jgi:hypothetical protein
MGHQLLQNPTAKLELREDLQTSRHRASAASVACGLSRILHSLWRRRQVGLTHALCFRGGREQRWNALRLPHPWHPAWHRRTDHFPVWFPAGFDRLLALLPFVSRYFYAKDPTFCRRKIRKKRRFPPFFGSHIKCL